MVSAVAPTTRSRQTHLHALSQRRVLNSLRRMLITLLTLSTIMAGQTRADEQETSWNVMAPPGPWRDISIDTTTTTWSFLDVSPDGREIVFDMLGDIYTVPIEGGDATPLTQGIEWNFQPTYSPDGGSIAFISDRDGNDNLWILDRETGSVSQVSSERRYNIHNPAWSPDGQWIAGRKGIVSRRSIPAGEIWLYNAMGGGGVPLVKHPDGEKAQKSIAEPAFTPDGKHIYFSQDVTSGWVWQYNKDSTGELFGIKRLDLATGDTVTVTGGAGGAVRPVPSPNGDSLAFVKRLSNSNSAIFVKDLKSGAERAVYSTLERDNQETAGSHGNTTAFDWLPNGKELIFWSAGQFHRVDVATGDTSTIPIRVKANLQLRDTVRFPVEVSPASFNTKMLRWAQQAPDAKSAVFQALGHLYRKDLTGDSSAPPTRLTRQTSDLEYWPSLTADGRSVVYSTWNDKTLGAIKKVSSRGGKPETLTAEPGHYVEPRFSPDGKQIVYRKITGGYLLSPLWSTEPGIYRLALDGSEPVKLTRYGADAHFNAEGDRVFFSTRGEGGLELRSVNLQGQDEITHAIGRQVTSYSISPNGKWLAFTEHFTAYVMPFTDTGSPLNIARDNSAIPTKAASLKAGEFLHWSQDSSALLWSNGPVLMRRDMSDIFLSDALTDEDESEDKPQAEIAAFNLSFEVETEIPASSVALVGATVVTMRDAGAVQEVIENGTVVVVGNRISAVGKATDIAIPKQARVLDVTGKRIVPGFIDAHAHGGMASEEIIPQQNWMQYSNLAFGVTTIHDPSNDTSEIFAHAEMQRTGQILGPRTYSTGTILYGANSPSATSEVHNLDEAEFHIQRLKAAGAISVKSYNQLARSARQQIIEAADRHQIMVMPEGGMKFQHNLNQLVDGHTSIEHSIPIAHIYDDVKQLWRATETGYVPTFGVAYGGISGENYFYDRTEVWRNERLMRYTPKQFVEPRSMRRTTAPDHHYNHVNVASTAKELRDLGVPVMIGAHGQREGLAAHWEMWIMVQGGFSPWEALRGATSDAAKHLGMDKDLGSIEAGKLADLVIIEGDVLTDIRQSEYISHTMLNGRLYEAASMNEVVTGDRRREPFYFEGISGHLLPKETTEAIETKMERHHWRH